MSKINELKYTKIRGVKSPVRANPTDAGIDIFVPYDLTKVDMNKMIGMTKCNVRVDTSVSTGCVTNIIIGPGETALIPTGLCVNVPDGYVLKVEDKSSVATVKGLHVTAGVIDASYTGEIMVHVVNVTNKDASVAKMAVLNPSDKFAQLVLYPIETPQPVEVGTKVELFKDKETARGDGGFGSTGNA